MGVVPFAERSDSLTLPESDWTNMSVAEPVELVGPFLYPVLLFAAGLVGYGVIYLLQRLRAD